MRRIALLVLFFAAGLSFAAEVSDNVKMFKARYKAGLTTSHRSGLAGSSDSAEAENAKAEEKPRWKGDKDALAPKSLREYRIVYDDGVRELGRLCKERFPHLKVEIYEEALKEFQLHNDSHLVNLKEDLRFTPKKAMSVEALRKEADKLLHTMPYFKGKMEFETHELEKLNGSVVAVAFRYRRVFQNRLVRSDVSYVYVVLGTDGNLRGINLRWPSFIPEGMASPLSLEDAIRSADAWLETMPEAVIGGKRQKVKRKKMDGVAFSWKEDKDRNLLVPAISVMGEIEYGDGFKITPIYDYPIPNRLF